MKLWSYVKPAVFSTIVLMVVCGLLYPFFVTGVSQVFFNHQANGSMVEKNGEIIGSTLIGQTFTDAGYFQGRPSSVNYNMYDKGDDDFGGVSSGSFNYGPSNPALMERVESSLKQFKMDNPTVKSDTIPLELLSASGSGLDPHISIKSAKVQVARIAKVRHLSLEEVHQVIKKATEYKMLGIFGENKVNVLKANLLIDQAVKN